MRQATIGARTPSFTIRILSTVAAVALVAGCQTVNTGGDATRSTALGASVQLIDRDVEAPEVFQETELALWDGRPSLGGVWVASPDVREPERVMIRNEETGKFVIGALFKRERLAPGPKLQLSSDAAIALGANAGTPVTLDIVALRREEAPDPKPVIAEAEPEALAEAEAEAPVEAEAVAAMATAAIADTTPEAEAEAEIAATAEEVIDPDTNSVDVLMIAARALAAKRAADAAAAQAAARAATEAAAAEAAVATPLDGAAPPEVSATSLDAPAAAEQAAAAPAAAPDATQEAPRRRGLAALFGGRNEAATPEPLPAVTAEAPRVAFVQIGLYDDETNARAAAEQLTGAGVLPTVKPQGNGWRVFIGPAPSDDDRAAILRKAKDLGFSDAYPVAS